MMTTNPSSTLDGFATPTIDVSDPIYRADPAFAPDKLEHWSAIPTEEDGWVHAHNAVRFELSELKRAIDAVGATSKLADWQVASVKAYVAGHLVHVHEHHHNEDDIFNPFLRSRINYPDKLEVDHVAIVAIMNEIERAANSLAVGSTLGSLADLWERYTGMMLPHLHEEEVVGLPLARAYFTPAEIGKVVESFMKNADPVAMGSFVHVLGGKKEAQTFMVNHGIPKFVWHVPGKGFKALRTLYRVKMQSHIDSLVAGKVVTIKRRPKELKEAWQTSQPGAGGLVAKKADLENTGGANSPMRSVSLASPVMGATTRGNVEVQVLGARARAA